MEHGTGASEAWARLVREILTCTSWLMLLRVTIFVLVCTPAVVALALALLLRQ